MHNILSLILETKKKKVTVLKKNRPALLSLIKKASLPISFLKAINRPNKISLIAEIKQASPSAGILRKDFSFLAVAKIYQKNLVNAISVLTEEEFFLGKLKYIEEIKNEISLPILCKDFIIDETQILEARASGADAVLLIANILDDKKLAHLYKTAKDLGMDALVEVHSEKELHRVLNLNVDIIGINNRNLNTLKVDIKQTEKLIHFVSKETIKVSESGINSLKDVLWLKGLGVNAMLVGEAFMKAENIEEKIKELHVDA